MCGYFMCIAHTHIIQQYIQQKHAHKHIKYTKILKHSKYHNLKLNDKWVYL